MQAASRGCSIAARGTARGSPIAVPTKTCHAAVCLSGNSSRRLKTGLPILRQRTFRPEQSGSERNACLSALADFANGSLGGESIRRAAAAAAKNNPSGPHPPLFCIGLYLV